jgi:hypothetical protein
VLTLKTNVLSIPYHFKMPLFDVLVCCVSQILKFFVTVCHVNILLIIVLGLHKILKIWKSKFTNLYDILFTQ